VIEEFRTTRLPFDLDDGGRQDWLGRVLASLTTLLGEEYAERPTGKAAALRASGRDVGERSVGLLRVALPQEPRVLAAAPARRGGAPEDLKSRVEQLSKALRDATVDRRTPSEAEDLVLASGGLYLDTVVGAKPSTGPYSEALRAEEIRMRAAEVAVKEADSTYQRTLAARLRGAGAVDTENWLTGILPDIETRTLLLSLRLPLSPGEWEVVVDGKARGTIEPAVVGRRRISRSWTDEQDWLAKEDLARRVQLIDRTSASTIALPRGEEGGPPRCRP
jgi:hypothetical protein